MELTFRINNVDTTFDITDRVKSVSINVNNNIILLSTEFFRGSGRMKEIINFLQINWKLIDNIYIYHENMSYGLNGIKLFNYKTLFRDTTDFIEETLCIYTL